MVYWIMKPEKSNGNHRRDEYYLYVEQAYHWARANGMAVKWEEAIARSVDDE